MSSINNCFTYSYKKLIALGYKVPTEWEGYTDKDMRIFIVNYKEFLESKSHYKFFESFCKYVDSVEKDDIIIDGNCIGIAVNKYKYITVKESTGLSGLYDIEPNVKIMRVVD